MVREPGEGMLLSYIDVNHAARILQAISAYAHLEYEIDEMIWELAGVEPEIGACLTAQLVAIAPRLDALISLARAQHVSEPHIEKLNGVKNSILALSSRRHRLAHDPWFFEHKTRVLYRLEKTAKAKLVHAYEPVTQEQLKAYEDEIVAVTERFRDVRREIMHAFWSAPYKHPKGSD